LTGTTGFLSTTCSSQTKREKERTHQTFDSTSFNNMFLGKKGVTNFSASKGKTGFI
jgi:hypothetical protein